MIGIHTIYLYLTCVCVQGEFLVTYYTYIISKRGKPCVLGVLISGSCMRAVLNSNNECTPVIQGEHFFERTNGKCHVFTF